MPLLRAPQTREAKRSYEISEFLRNVRVVVRRRRLDIAAEGNAASRLPIMASSPVS
jgi:hypothetical protein